MFLASSCMEHTNATHARRVYDALANGDLTPAVDAMADDMVMINDIGAGPWREVHGKQGVLDFFGRWMELFDNTFRQQVLDVIGYDDRIVIVLHETGAAQGQQFDNRAIYLVDVEDGQWTSLRTVDLDRHNIEQFWNAVSTPAVST